MYHFTDSPKLFLIGNGFDITHNLPTKYKDFKIYFEENFASEYQTFNRFYKWTDIEWNSFEKNLANINPYATKALDELYEQYSDDLEMSMRSLELADQEEHLGVSAYKSTLMHIAAERSIFNPQKLENKLRQAFCEWAGQIDKGVDYLDKTSLHTCPHKLYDGIIMPAMSYFISFNYTHVLEKLYAIHSDRILHVHGEAQSPDSIIFGHSDPEVDPLYVTPKDCPRVLINKVENWKKQYLTTLAKEYQLEIVDEFITDKCINEIISIGCSFGEVDHPYYDLINQRFPNAEWRISFYGKENRNKIETVLTHLKIKRFQLIDLDSRQNRRAD